MHNLHRPHPSCTVRAYSAHNTSHLHCTVDHAILHISGVAIYNRTITLRLRLHVWHVCRWSFLNCMESHSFSAKSWWYILWRIPPYVSREHIRSNAFWFSAHVDGAFGFSMAEAQRLDIISLSQTLLTQPLQQVIYKASTMMCTFLDVEIMQATSIVARKALATKKSWFFDG